MKNEKYDNEEALMYISYKDNVVHAHKDIKKIKKSINDFLDTYEDILSSDLEDDIYEARICLDNVERNLYAEINATLGE